MPQQIKNEITQLLSRNVGSRLTEDLIIGLSVKIGSIIEPPLRDLERLRQEQQQPQEQGNG